MSRYARASTQRFTGLVAALIVSFSMQALAEPPDKVPSEQADSDIDIDDGTFAISPPVICSQIAGYEDYEKRPNSILTKDEKLLLYFRPRHFKTEKQGKKYQASFSEDLRIRKRGQTFLLFKKDKFAEFKHSANERPEVFFLRTSISLKTLKPGDYELDIILHDEVSKSAPAKRTISFKIVDSSYKPPEDAEEPKRSSERPGSS